MPRLRPAVRVGLGTFALVAGMAWIPGTAMAAPANITIVSAGPDGSGNPYDLTVVANDGNGAARSRPEGRGELGALVVRGEPVVFPAHESWLTVAHRP